jgi:hypothetical protein
MREMLKIICLLCAWGLNSDRLPYILHKALIININYDGFIGRLRVI